MTAPSSRPVAGRSPARDRTRRPPRLPAGPSPRPTRILTALPAPAPRTAPVGWADPAGATGIDLDDITVIVPTRNEAGNIERFLAALPDRLRLIVVDSSSDDTLRRVARLRPDRTTVVSARLNIPEARQVGTDLAVTPWLLFTDADVTLAADYAEMLAHLPVDDDVAGVIGVKGTAGGHEGYHRWFIRGQRLLSWFGVPAASGSNLLVRADVVAAVGGFDTRLTVNEDSELMFRVRRAGHRVLFAPDLVAEAIDHRRLDAGRTRKMLHSVSRCALLWARPRSDLVRRGDWGYWRHAD